MFDISIKRYLKEARAEETKKINVDQAKVRIGSGAGNEIELAGVGISINHAVIEKSEDNTYWITDLGSSQGTFVNNVLISGKEQLSDRDEIKIGLYNFSLSLPASADENAEVIVTETQIAEDSGDVEAPVSATGPVIYVSKFKLSNRIISITSLSVIGVILMILLSIYWFGEDDQTAYTPGPLSRVHSKFNDDCAECHTVAWNTVPDGECLSCHKVNPHNRNENFTPECVTCHLEHHGNTVLTEVRDTECTQCHADLVTVNFVPSEIYARNIDGFDSDHPEFAVNVRGKGENSAAHRVRLSDKNNLSDNTPIMLNHSVHLKEGLLGSEGFVNLNCENCHHFDSGGEYAMAIEYERDCSRCHTLEFDIRFGDLVVPHSSTEEVVDFLSSTYTKYAVDKNTVWTRSPNIDDVRGWASARVKETSGSLFRTKCAECHILEDAVPNNGVMRVLEPDIPLRWLPHANFDHELHVKQLDLRCDSCHDASNSVTTTDVLIPSIKKCQQCHSSDGGAITDCVLCHNYHERDEADQIEGTKTIKEVIEN